MRFFIIAGLFTVSGCAENVHPPDPSTIAEIQETVFRHLFEKNNSAVKQKAKTYFVSIKNMDPGNEFLKRFEGHQPPVQEGSNFKEGKGLLFRVDKIKWISNNRVEVEGGYYENGKSAQRNLYYVNREGEKWRVTKEVPSGPIS